MVRSSSPSTHPSHNTVPVPPITVPKMSNATVRQQHCHFGGIRFLVLALSTLCLTLGMSNTVALHFTVVCMKKDNSTAIPPSSNNESSSSSDLAPAPTAMFSFAQQGWLFSALSLGTLLASAPLHQFCSRIGFRSAFTIYGLLGGLATIATPAAAQLLPQPYNFVALFCARMFQGLILATSYVSMELISKNWSPLRETTIFISILSCHLQMGRIITMPLAGFLCESRLGWPALYYLLGTLTILAFLLFFLIFRDSPRNQRFITDKEICTIQLGKTHQHNYAKNTDSTSNPRGFSIYIGFLMNPHLWAIFAVDVGIVLGNHLFAQYGPTYLNKTVGLTTNRTGVVVALPFLISAILAIVVGQLIDRVRIGQRTTLVLLTSVSQYIMAIGYILLALIPLSNQLLIQLCYVVLMSFVGLCVVGIVKQIRWVEASNAQAFNALNTAFTYFILMLIPALVNLIIPNAEEEHSNGGWKGVFFAIAAVQMLSGAISQISVMLKKDV